MSHYTVLEVSNTVRDWMAQGKFPMKEYRVNLREHGSNAEHLNVEWSRKLESPAPTVGQVIDGELRDRGGEHGWKFHLANPQSGGYSGSEDPKRAARIMRQHSQQMSMQALTHAFAFGLLEPPVDSAALFSLIAKTADWFDADARRAGDNA